VMVGLAVLWRLDICEPAERGERLGGLRE